MTDETERARLASAILGNPLFDEALAVLREGYVQMLVACDVKDDAGRRAYTMAIRDLHTVKNHIAIVLQRGEIKSRELQQLKQDQETESVWKRVVRGFASDDARTERSGATTT